MRHQTYTARIMNAAEEVDRRVKDAVSYRPVRFGIGLVTSVLMCPVVFACVLIDMYLES